MSQLQVSRSTEIERPMEEVFRFVADPSNDPRWCRMVRRSEPVSGIPGQAGARYAQVQIPGPVGSRIDLELVEADAPEHVRLRWWTSVATFDVTYELAETDGRTQLTHTSEVSLRGLGRAVSQPLVRVALPRSMEQQLGDLRVLLEGAA